MKRNVWKQEPEADIIGNNLGNKLYMLITGRSKQSIVTEDCS
jgi:hypothetical protein